MEKKGMRPGGPSGNHSLNSVEESEIRRCDFSGFILEEELMIKGAGQILNEFGCSPDGDGGENAESRCPHWPSGCWAKS